MPSSIAIDAMGGDFGPSVTVPACGQILSKNPDLSFLLYGDELRLKRAVHALNLAPEPSSRLVIRHTSQDVGMDENPLRALKGKKDASMRRCIDAVHSGEADACVSAGNTGALLAMANHVLGTLPGVARPGLFTAIAQRAGCRPVHAIDLGANIDSTPDYLMDFALMGATKIQARLEMLEPNHDPTPRVALLSNGEEHTKGNQLVKATAKLLEKSSLNYIGYIEASALFHGTVDLVVCDGFAGNIAIKSCEGLVKYFKEHCKTYFTSSPMKRLMGGLLAPLLRHVFSDLSADRFNGASLLGVNGIVVKSHGSATVTAFAHAIEEALQEVRENIIERLRDRMQEPELEH